MSGPSPGHWAAPAPSRSGSWGTPYSFWLGTEGGLTAATVEVWWRALVLVFAVVGGVRLMRGLAPEGAAVDGGAESWTPWLGAGGLRLGAVLVPTLVSSPTDGLAAATLPWVVAPLLLHGRAWRPALASAVWVGVAGVGSPAWALAALGAGMIAALPQARSEVVGALRWLVLAAAASAWWIVLLIWETTHTVDVSALVRGGLRDAAAASLGRPGLPVVMLLVVAAGPLLAALAALLLRSPGLRYRFVLVLVTVSLALGLAAWVGDWRLPVAAPFAGETPALIAGPILGWLALAGAVAWCPLVDDLRERLRSARFRDVRFDRRTAAALLAAALVVATAFAGLSASVSYARPTAAGESELLDQVAQWSGEAAPGRVLVLPPDTGHTDLAGLGVALGDRPWVGRNTVPTSGPAGTAAIDDLASRLSVGDGGPGTLSALRRLGVSYVLVRLGGPILEDRAQPIGLVRAALRATGAERVAVLRGSEEDGDDDVLVDYGVRSITDQVEIWAPPATAGGWLYAGSAVDVVGDAGTVSDLTNAGVLRDRAVTLRTPSDRQSAVLSDSARRRDLDQRVPVNPYGPDLTVDAPRSVLPSDAAPVTSAARQLEGAESVTSSSSAADLDSRLRFAGTDAPAAIDGNTYTAWYTRRGTGVGQWWQVRFEGLTQLTGTRVQIARNAFAGYSVSKIRVDADSRSESYDVPEDGLVDLGALGRASTLRITLTGVDGTMTANDSLGIVEVSVPDTTVTNRLGLVDAPTESWLIAARTGSRAGCVPVVPVAPTPADEQPGTTCGGLLVGGQDTSTLDRSVTLGEQTSLSGRVWLVSSTAGAAADLADRTADPSIVATSGSVASGDLLDRGQAAADGNPSTAWHPSPGDDRPTLTLEWAKPADISGLRLLPPSGDVGSRPTQARVTAEAVGRRTGERVRRRAGRRRRGRRRDDRAAAGAHPQGHRHRAGRHRRA